jgi:sporulation protein YlmC with PRC-barrel domain
VEYVEPNIVKLSNVDFQLEEPWQDVRGFDVYDNTGDKIGTVEDLYFDRETHVARFFDVSAGGFLTMGKKHLLVPVEEFTRDASEEDRVRVNHDRDMVLESPEFDPDVVPDMDLQRTAYDYYGRPYPEEDSVAEPEKSPEEEDKGTIATVAKKVAKGAVKGAVKGAAKETTE